MTGLPAVPDAVGEAVRRRSYLPALAFGLALVSVHFALFVGFFPNESGRMGHDWAYQFPLLLNGFYWFLANGPAEPPWFSPAFCGGVPLLANPASIYYSVPQFLTFFADPVTAARLTLLVFAAAGYAGFWFLAVRVFRATAGTAALGATVFLFNGFYAHRLVIGHLEYHGFMLVPLVAGLVAEAAGAMPDGGPRQRLRCILLSGIGFAYMFMSGMATLMPAAALAVLGVGLLAALVHPDGVRPVRLVLATAASAGAACLLSAAKLSAALHYLTAFPRDAYRLPGVEGMGKLVENVLKALAFGGGAVDVGSVMSGGQWFIDRHEWEYGVTVVPFVLAGVFVLVRVRRFVRNIGPPAFAAGTAARAAALAAAAAVPLLLNLYEPSWNRWIRSIPGIGNATLQLRWLIVYLPLLALTCVVCVESAGPLRRRRIGIVVAGVLAVVGQNGLTDRDAYRGQRYEPARILAAHEAAMRTGRPPAVRWVVAYRDGRGNTATPLYRNDALAVGGSQLLCYEHMFGFRLENFPLGSLHPGSVLDVFDGRLNLKDPACYLYPEENGCRPGEHFAVSERDSLLRLAAYRPYAHAVSVAQRWANRTNLAALAAVGLFFALDLCLSLARRLSRDRRKAG